VTPLHPKANGEVERFMQTLNKTEQITNLQGKNHLERRNVVQDMLIAYKLTPHPATGVATYDALSGCLFEQNWIAFNCREMRRMTSSTAEMQNTSRK